MDSSEREKFLYETGTDATCEFANGESVRVNRTMLALNSKFFMDEFFGASPKTVVKIPNFDLVSFKTFLDCLFGLKEYTVLDSLLIYPIAHQYNVKESLQKCTSVLEPKEMSENVCVTLNLAVFYGSEDLEIKVLDFIKSHVGVSELMENKKYRSLLEPMSVCKLIETMELHSFIWELIWGWGEDYVKERNRSVDIRSFLDEIGIFSKLELDHFESAQCIFDFHEMTNMQLLDSNMILAHLKSNMLGPTNKFPDRSEWVKMGKDTLTETIEFSHPFGFSPQEHEKGVSIEIRTNRIDFDDCKWNKDPFLNVKYKYSFRRNVVKTDQCNHDNNCPRGSGYSSCTCFPPLKMSSVDYSGIKETNLKDFSEELFFQINVDVLQRAFQEIKGLEVTYDFGNIHKSRILKTSLNGNYNNVDELFFTKSVVVLPN